MLSYQTRNLQARTSPLRSIPLFQPTSILFRAPMPIFAPTPAPVFTEGRCVPMVRSAEEMAVRILANAEATLRDAVRVYDAARAGIGEANRRTLPSSTPAFILAQMRTPPKPIVLSAERIRERKSTAFRLFNQRRGELVRARRAVDAARAALGLSSLAVTEERAAVAVVVRANKQRPVIHSIASAAAHAA